MAQAIRAMYMRGGTSKGVFFLREDLPQDKDTRDRLLLRVIGSPDPYGRHTDGMGGATSSTSKVVLIEPSTRADCDVDYEFGQVAIDRPLIDWNGNCGNLSTAVGPFAIHRGLVPAADGLVTVRIWQRTTREVIHAHVPVAGGVVVEEGSFAVDGVTFPAAEIRLDFLGCPGGDDQLDLLPAGAPQSVLQVAGLGMVPATLLGGAAPTIFIEAAQLGLSGTEGQAEVNADAALLARCEAVRAAGAVRMGLAESAEEATQLRPHMPKLALVSPAAGYTASDGRRVEADAIDLNVRILSMGKLHHAVTGTGAIAVAVAAAIEGTLVDRQMQRPGKDGEVRFGHASGVMKVGARVAQQHGRWQVERVSFSRSARRLMDGQVFVPEEPS